MKTVAEYLAGAPADKRAALLKLRKTIKGAAPKATESVSYATSDEIISKGVARLTRFCAGLKSGA